MLWELLHDAVRTAYWCGENCLLMRWELLIDAVRTAYWISVYVFVCTHSCIRVYTLMHTHASTSTYDYVLIHWYHCGMGYKYEYKYSCITCIDKYIWLRKADCVWVGRKILEARGNSRSTTFVQREKRNFQTAQNGGFPSVAIFAGQLKRNQLYSYTDSIAVWTINVSINIRAYTCIDTYI